MTDCITIASWMLAVVGALMIGLMCYCIHRDLNRFDLPCFLVPTMCIVGAFGVITFVIGIYPYIPEITLPCITIIP